MTAPGRSGVSGLRAGDVMDFHARSADHFVVDDCRRVTMKAIVRHAYGSADGLALRDVDAPEIADDEVLVRVHAAGVDRGVWHVMTGLPYPIRLAGYGLRAPKTPVLGADLAGVVEAVGNDVTRFQARRRGVRRRHRAPSPSTRAPRRASWRPSRRTSPSSRPPWSPSPA